MFRINRLKNSNIAKRVTLLLYPFHFISGLQNFIAKAKKPFNLITDSSIFKK